MALTIEERSMVGRSPKPARRRTSRLICAASTLALLLTGAFAPAASALEPDVTAPSILITSPAAEPPAVVTVGEELPVAFTCTDPDVADAETSELADCSAVVVPEGGSPEDGVSIAEGSLLDTSAPGRFVVTVAGIDGAGNAATSAVAFEVVEPVPPADTTPPVITITSPTATIYDRGPTMHFDFSCEDADSALIHRVGSGGVV